jgi:hypothetical protein
MPFSLVQFKKFIQAQITAAAVTIYTTPALSQDVIKNIDITNTSATAVGVTMNLVPTGGTAGVANQFFGSISVPANSTLHWTGTQVMNAGDFISVVASVTAVTNIMVSGLEST